MACLHKQFLFNLYIITFTSWYAVTNWKITTLQHKPDSITDQEIVVCIAWPLPTWRVQVHVNTHTIKCAKIPLGDLHSQPAEELINNLVGVPHHEEIDLYLWKEVHKILQWFSYSKWNKIAVSLFILSDPQHQPLHLKNSIYNQSMNIVHIKGMCESLFSWKIHSTVSDAEILLVGWADIVTVQNAKLVWRSQMKTRKRAENGWTLPFWKCPTWQEFQGRQKQIDFYSPWNNYPSVNTGCLAGSRTFPRLAW